MLKGGRLVEGGWREVGCTVCLCFLTVISYVLSVHGHTKATVLLRVDSTDTHTYVDEADVELFSGVASL